MADFCKQCSIKTFGEDTRDLAGLGRTNPDEGRSVICEGCGPTLVNNDGECVYYHCPIHGGKKEQTTK